jgi:hypothetical protein
MHFSRFQANKHCRPFAKIGVHVYSELFRNGSVNLLLIGPPEILCTR